MIIIIIVAMVYSLVKYRPANINTEDIRDSIVDPVDTIPEDIIEYAFPYGIADDNEKDLLIAENQYILSLEQEIQSMRNHADELYRLSKHDTRLSDKQITELQLKANRLYSQADSKELKIEKLLHKRYTDDLKVLRKLAKDQR